MADIDPCDPQDTVASSVAAAVNSSAARQAARELEVAVALELPDAHPGEPPSGTFA